MTKKETAEIERALNALEMVQGMILRNHGIKTLVQPDAARLNKTIHIIALVIALSLMFTEIFLPAVSTNLLLLSNTNKSVLIFNIVNIALGLTILSIGLHFLIIHRAKKLSANFKDYVDEHFQYLANFSFLTDLFVKFVIVSIVIVAKKPEWVAPILSLFIGDYLFQGRFFVFPLTRAYTLGVLCWLIATLQLTLGDPSLVWSLLLFSCTCLMSLFYLNTFSNKNS